MAHTYRVAVIGLGAIGRRMLTNMPRQGRLEIAGGWDVDAAACAAAARDFPGLAVAGRAEALIADPATDVVYIGVPPAAHAGYARAAIAARKAVFCEKPLGIDLAESRALTAEMDASGLPQAVNLSLASARGVAQMRAALADGRLGEIAGADLRLHFGQWPRPFQASAAWLAGRAEGGFTREVATHFLYLAESLFGPGRVVSASPRFPEPEAAESHVTAHLDFAGTPLTYAGSTGGAGPDLVEVTLWGSAQSLRLTDFYRLWHTEGEGWAETFPDLANPAQDAYMRQLDALVAMLDGEETVLPRFADALRVQELVEGILAA